MQTMKLDPRTVQIIKNFSLINPSLLFKPGSTLRTMSPSKTILAKAKVPDNFESEFAIYETNKWLGVISLFNDPELRIDEKFMTIQSGNGKARTRYSFTDPSMIITAPEKDIKMPATIASFKITAGELNDVLKAAAFFKHPEVAFIAKDGMLSLSAVDSNNKNKDPYDIALTSTDAEFTMYFKLESMKPIPDDYEVTISRGISHWKREDLEYFIASEQNSTFA